MEQHILQDQLQEHFFDVFDQIANGIVITEPNEPHNIIYVNETFTDIFEYTAEECIGKNCKFLQNDDTEQNNIQLIREAIKDKKSIQTVLRNYTKNGKLIYNEVKISPIFDKERKHLKYFIGIQKNLSNANIDKDNLLKRMTDNAYAANDIDTLLQELNTFQTELLAQNEELIERDKHLETLNNEFSSLFHDAPIAYIVIDENLEVKKFNKLANEYFHFASYKRINSLFSMIKEGNLENLLGWISYEFYKNKNLEIDIYCNSLKKRNRFELHAKRYMINEKYLLISLNNIQESHEIKTMLEDRVKNEVSKRLEQEKFTTNQAKLASMGEMIDAIAHQWLNPLSSIKIYAQATKMKLSKTSKNYETVLKNQENIDIKVNHLVETLKEFRSFFRPVEELETVQIADIIDSCLILMKDELYKSKIKVSVDKQNDFSMKILKNQFKHVIINLLRNSRDAFIGNNIKDRQIKFTFDSDQDNHFMRYYDNAGGIPEHIINKIFEANFTTKQKTNGTGIGLYLCKQILDKFHISIHTKNVEDGACFEIKYSKLMETFIDTNKFAFKRTALEEEAIQI